jgi:glycosyltransferase involved in cell wall biosynthesis
MPMRVMHIFGKFGLGGAEVGALRLIQSLHSQEIEHAICNMRLNVSERGDLPTGIRFYSLGVERSNRVAFVKLFWLLRKTRTDIAHANNLAPWFDVAVASRLAGCKCVETFHGIEEEIRRLSEKKRLILKMAMRLTKSVTAVSSVSRDKLEELTGIKSDQVRVIENGVDTNFFKPLSSQFQREELRRSLDLPEKALLIGCVGALRPVKDHVGLLQAFAKFQSIIEDQTARENYLVLVGDGALMPELREISRGLKTGDRVLFLGRRTDVARILPALDIFVLNSKTEGMSYAMLEAMASGLPIIATDVGANRELISHGMEGYLYPPGDLNSLVNYLISLHDNESLLFKMKDRARAKVVNHFSLERMVSSYSQLYRDAIRER